MDILSRTVYACRNDFAIVDSDAKTVVNIINTLGIVIAAPLEFHLRNDRGMPVASVSRASQVSCGRGNNKCIRQPTPVNLRSHVYVYILVYMSYLAEMNIKIARQVRRAVADRSRRLFPPLPYSTAVKSFFLRDSSSNVRKEG